MMEAYTEVNSLPREPDDNLERVVASLMMYSDSTHLSNFGDASLWPFYVFFGNESKYTRGKPTASACHHVAYIPTVSLFTSLEAALIYETLRFPTIFKILILSSLRTRLRQRCTHTANVSLCRQYGNSFSTETLCMLMSMAL
jgi:hypothetical protein